MCIFVFHDVPEMILNTDYFMLLFIKTLFCHECINISSILKDLPALAPREAELVSARHLWL